MSIDVEALKASVDIAAIVGSYVSLKKRGQEFLGLCPFHADTNPSFYVIPDKRFCNCFSCGWSGDVIDFLQQHDGIDFKEACNRLGNGNHWTPKPITQEAKPRPERTTSKPPPDAGQPNMTLERYGPPSMTWAYRDAGGDLLGYVARYDTPEGKQIRCWSWGAKGSDDPEWGCGHFSKPRPLYGLDLLAARPNAWVLAVEGEKAADAARELLPTYAAVTWPGGAQAWKHADWEPLRGRSVLLWPDADKVGLECMEKLAGVLVTGLRCTVRIIDPLSGDEPSPEGWDAADALHEGWSTDDVTQWAKPRAKNFRPDPAPQVEAAAPPPAHTPTAEEVPPRNAEAPAEAGPDIPIEAYADDAGRPAKPPLPPNPPASDDGPLPAEFSDDALAEHLVNEHGENWRYVKPWAQWFRWDGDGWRRDDKGEIDRVCLEITRSCIYWPAAAGLTPEGKRRTNSRRTAGAMRDNASNHRRIAASMDQWDADPWLLGCPGGVLELRSGKMLEAERSQYITKRCACAPEAERPALWLEFLKRVTSGDDSLIGYLQRFSGYALTGETSEHSLAFLYGTGANGKTVFLQTLSGILGDYASSAGIETFTETKNERHSTEIARLRGARLVVTEETESGGRWAEGKIKRLTGGGKIAAHFMRQDDFEFTPQFKLMIAGNHKPMLKSVDEAIRRRFHLVPFNVTIPPEERDKHLFEKLREEWPRILGWMLDGCVAWQECSLGLPEAIQDATDQYLQAEDVLGQWLDDRCERDTEASVESAAAYRSFGQWCEEQGERTWSRRTWMNAMVDRGFAASRTSSARTVRGIRIKLREPNPDYRS